MKVFKGIVMTLLVVCWSLATLLFDRFAADRFYHQWQAAQYPATDGRIIHSELTKDYDDGKVFYGTDLRYTYRVEGQEYTGTRYRYGDVLSTDDRAKNIIHSMPVNTKVTVYHSPCNPADAVLNNELEATDLALPLFMLPFNLIMIGGWTVVAKLIHRWITRPPAGGAEIRDLDGRVSVRVGYGSPLWGAGAAAAGTSLAASVLLGFCYESHPPIWIFSMAWAIVAGATLATYAWMAGRAAMGAYDLVIDPAVRTLTLPPGAGRRNALEIPFETVDSVESIEVVLQDPEHNGTHRIYVPTITCTTSAGIERREKLPRWFDEEAAQDFVDWLRQQIHIEPSPQDDRLTCQTT